MFSKACEYAIRATLYISKATSKGSRIGIKKIAKEISSPEPFTAKILQTLSREGIISSVKGPNGGFYIDPDARPIPLNSIVQAFDGDPLLTCTLGLKECSNKFPCPIHHEIKEYKNHVQKFLKEKTIQDLTQELSKGKTFLKIGKQG